MSIAETILGGIIVALVAMILGKLWGEKGKLTEEQCEARRAACATPFCHDLEMIKAAQKEMKEDIKEIKKYIMDGNFK